MISNFNHELKKMVLHIATKSFVFVLIAILLSENFVQAEPFVAGFDRFGVHQEIDQTLAHNLLITELNCTACHQSEQATLTPKGAPNLNGAGTRFTRNWLRDYLLAPEKIKPGSTMPDFLHGLKSNKKLEVATAIAEFLSTQVQPFPVLKANGIIPVQHEFWLKGNIENGGKLYHSVGCVACHAPDKDYQTEGTQASSLDKLLDQLDPEELAELGLSGKARVVNSIPHGELSEKYTLLSLSHFLHNPERTRSAGRMPNLKLLPSDAADIAAYLLRDQKQHETDSSPAANDELVQAGKTYFVELGCVNCHSLKGVEAPVETQPQPFARLNFAAENSCLANPKQSQPAYALSKPQRDVLQQVSDTKQKTVSEAGLHQLRMLQLNCFACHERDELGGIGRNRQQYFETVGHVDIGDEGRFPPALTHVGKKLTPSWFNQVFAGKGDIRPHMTIRMPMFPKSLVKDLPPQLAKADGASAASEREVFGDISKLAQPGRELLNTGCIQCHPLRGENLASVVGTDLNQVHQRVRPAWFKEFLLNPIALKNRTRMPTFFPNGGSSNPTILEGNVDQQIAAIWAYLIENEKHPLPEKILTARSKNFELVPTDKPIVLRTFMDKAGVHAIAVGFPEKVNIAFDSENCRLVEAWKGRFLDAHGTWYDRFTPLAEPLGAKRIEMPLGVSLSMFIGGLEGEVENLKRLSKKQFLGYQLDKFGVPTFRYEMAGYLIEERIASDPKGNLHWQISMGSIVAGTKITTPNITPRFELLTGAEIEKIDNHTFINEKGVTVKLPANSPLKPTTMRHPKHPDGGYCSSPIPTKPERIEFEVIYKW